MKKFINLLCLVLLVVNFSFSNEKVKNKTDKYSYDNKLFFKPDAAAIKWVNQTYSSLTLEEKVAQLIIPVSAVHYQSRNSKPYKELVNLVKKKKVGGFIFSVGDVYSVAEIANSLQKHAKVPLLISADYEKGGVAMRVDRATYFPNNMAIGAANDSLLTFEMGKIIGKEGRYLGVHQNYSPVMDVNNNPQNPIINVRSFGEDPQLIVKLGKALMHGLHAGGMVSCLKHFPGHGDTDIDSHSDLPILNFDKKRLETIELFPFRSAIKDNAPSVMVSHLSVPVFDDEKLPASLSYKIITGLLKKEMNFNGLIVTDGMEMRGITKHFSVSESTVKAIQAGHDLVVIPPNVNVAIKALHSAVKKGEISMERLEHSVKKVLLMKYCLGLHKNKFVNTEDIPDFINTVENNGVSKKLAQKSITLLKNESILPLQKNGKYKIACITFSDNTDASTGVMFERGFSNRYKNVEFLKIDTRTSESDFEKIYSKAKESDVILLPVYLRVRSYSGTVGFNKQHKIYADTLQQLGKKMIVVSYGNPYIVSSFSPNITAYLTAYGDAPASIEAGLEALFGEISITGKLPINIPGFYKIGDGIQVKKGALQASSLYDIGLQNDSFDPIDELMDNAVNDSIFPGGVLLVSKDGKVFYNKAVGNFTYDENSKLVQTNTMFDLASVSKVMGTTNAAMKLVGENKLYLDSSVSFYLPKFNSKGKDKILVRNLLQHDSGLPPFKLFYKMCKSPEEIMDSIYACEILFSPGDSVVYSDIGMITLGKVMESITGKTLDVYLNEEIFSPLGLIYTMYKPNTKLAEICAPTEVDDYWRMRTVQGTVHDENADALGGVAGHAGLFSTVDDLAVIVQMLLNKGTYNGRQYLKPEIIELFLTRVRNTSRTLGWGIRPLKGSYYMGDKFSNNSFGHTGFTGTSICVDPYRNLFVILLTNRVYPTRNNDKISSFRKILHDKIIECMENKNNILTITNN